MYVMFLSYSAAPVEIRFLKNIHKSYLTPNRRGMGCILWIQRVIDILPDALQSFMHYLTILDRVIMALDCISRTDFVTFFSPKYGSCLSFNAAGVSHPKRAVMSGETYGNITYQFYLTDTVIIHLSGKAEL